MYACGGSVCLANLGGVRGFPPSVERLLGLITCGFIETIFTLDV